MKPSDSSNPIQTQCMPTAIAHWLKLRNSQAKSSSSEATQSIPCISEARKQASISDRPFDLSRLPIDVAESAANEETVLYLGYGSNLSYETFRGKRNIRPLSQMNVVVPELSLTFNLPGIPYSEPCFGNVRYRNTKEKSTTETHSTDYHKDRWLKGLVGVVYEVTQSDYAHIIATEGGGASYHDVLVDCHALPLDPSIPVPEHPTTPPFKAHTLFSPASVPRPDPSYAQPSPRYLNLITTGAAEHNLSTEYQSFLNQIGTYKITSARQRLGQYTFLSIWGPIFAIIFGGAAAMFQDKDGRYPPWFARFAMATFTACWGSYDNVFKGMYGDGERTVEKRDEEMAADRRFSQDEKEKLISKGNDYGAMGRSVEVDQ